MNISLNWLKQYVELPENITPAELGLKLTLSTVEIENITDTSEKFKNIVVGRIDTLAKHPNADRLRLVEVDLGDKKVKLVCGGVNLIEGMLVAVALPGAKVRWHGEGELVTLEKTKVRGEESEGMICASEELDLAELYPSLEDGYILDLTEKNIVIGTNLGLALGLADIIFEVDNKSLTNRPDLWGHYGLAREVSALYDLDLKKYPSEKIKSSKEEVLKVEIKAKELCSRYQAVKLSGVTIGPSPAWLVEKLQAIGQKSINNIVDITNYIMFDLGQPLHAFSADAIKGETIVVRTAKAGEKIVSLDKERRSLTVDDLVIADEEKVIALAGIMGNQNSEITHETKEIIIESANFNPVAVRKTSGRLGLRTEASMRFEKSLDPEMTDLALKRAVSLILAICPESRVVTPVAEEKNLEKKAEALLLPWTLIDERIGQKIDRSLVKKILTGLGFGIKLMKTGLKVMVPSWRATKDISIKEDLIEEITRIYGYDNLEPVMPAVKIESLELNKLRDLERKVKNFLCYAGGANEVYNYAFVDRGLLEKMNQPIDHIQIANPWSEQVDLLRKNLTVNLTQNIVDNYHNFLDVNIFEVGRVFVPNEKGLLARPGTQNYLPKQIMSVGSAMSGALSEKLFFTAKGIITDLGNDLNVEFEFITENTVPGFAHPKQCLSIMVDNEKLGYLTSLHPEVAINLSLEKMAVVLWEINLELLLEHSGMTKKHQTVIKYPAIELDLSLLLDAKVLWKDVEALILATAPKIIRRVELLDVFKGDKIEVGKKSLTCRVVYQVKDRTLSLEEAQNCQKSVLEQLTKAVGAKLRV